MRKRFIAFVPLFAITLWGCGPGEKFAEVTGVVKYKGTPLTAGRVAFMGADNSVGASDIQADGTYTIARIAPGMAKIGVTPPPAPIVNPQMKGKGGVPGREDDVKNFTAPTASKVKLPAAAGDPDKSGLSYTVTDAPKQTHDIEIK